MPDTRRPLSAVHNRSLGVRLAAFTSALLVPILLFAGFLIWQYAKSERSRYENEALSTARRLSAVIDRELLKYQGSLTGLATSRLIDSQSLAELHQQAAEVSRFIGSVVIIKDVTGQQLVNTRLGPGVALPVSLPASDREAIAKRAATISDLFSGSTAGRPLVSINVPVLRDDRILGVINTGIFPERIAAQVQSQSVPETWAASIIDRNGIIIARSVAHEANSGRKASVDVMRAAAGGRDGVFRGQTVTGEAVLAAYVKSDISGWITAVGVPVSIVEDLVKRSLLYLLALGAGALLVYGLIAWLLGKRMAAPLRQLALAAESVGSGRTVDVPDSRISEVSAIAKSLLQADRNLRLHEVERDRSEQALRQAQDELQALNANLESLVEERTRALADSNRKLVAEVSHREDIEQRLRQAQKMEAVGQLTGGIAHDFNNLLAIITGSLALLRRRLDRGDTDSLRRYVDNAAEGASRAVVLVQRLLAFARRQPLSPQPVEPNTLLAGMSELLRRSLTEGIPIKTAFGVDVWRIHADPHQLENAILNLSLNARDAMPEGGKLKIETANCELDEHYVQAHPGAAAGQYVMISVTDNGVGIPRDKQDLVFDPFYTTKPAGRGTGLGLSQVYGFVRQTGGHVTIDSDTGRGTSVKLYLPRFISSDATPAAPPQPFGEPHQGRETILVVEDEAGVRQMTVESLRELGYVVVEADGGAAALRHLDSGMKVDLVFTDVVMPEMNGRKLADEVAQRRPGLPVLFTTGYARDAIVHDGIVEAGVHLLTKPFTYEQLAQKLREVLPG
jgi:signal transduction histidine kinase